MSATAVNDIFLGRVTFCLGTNSITKWRYSERIWGTQCLGILGIEKILIECEKFFTLIYASALPARGRECVNVLQMFLCLLLSVFFVHHNEVHKYETTVLGNG